MKQIRFKVHSICVFLMFLLMIPFGAFAQQGMVTGQVVDEKGESVIGAKWVIHLLFLMWVILLRK